MYIIVLILEGYAGAVQYLSVGCIALHYVFW